MSPLLATAARSRAIDFLSAGGQIHNTSFASGVPVHRRRTPAHRVQGPRFFITPRSSQPNIHLWAPRARKQPRSSGGKTARATGDAGVVEVGGVVSERKKTPGLTPSALVVLPLRHPPRLLNATRASSKFAYSKNGWRLQISLASQLMSIWRSMRPRRRLTFSSSRLTVLPTSRCLMGTGWFTCRPFPSPSVLGKGSSIQIMMHCTTESRSRLRGSRHTCG